jgi:uncharacterized protein (TIGR02452 family)
MGHIENAEIFKDTDIMCEENAVLKQAIDEANKAQRFIPEEEDFTVTTAPADKCAKIIVSKKRSLEAAADYARAGKRVCVLNFASSRHPGGGVAYGARAQEESICRCSTLYKSLNQPEMWQDFYTPHENSGNRLNNDDIIYTPGVVAFKTDEHIPKLMPQENWFKVNVVTCAAPDLRMGHYALTKDGGTVEGNLRQLHEKRMRRILATAAEYGNEVVILGAFGCGAFKNPPEVVAEALKTVVLEFKPYFETIEFAVHCTDYDAKNYTVFDNVLNS